MLNAFWFICFEYLDYLKYDDCGETNIQSYAKFSAMRDGLNATGRPIVYSYEPHVTVPIEWPQYVGNAWRTGGDIGSSYGRMLSELEVVNGWAHATGPGAWGDADSEFSGGVYSMLRVQHDDCRWFVWVRITLIHPRDFFVPPPTIVF